MLITPLVAGLAALIASSRGRGRRLVADPHLRPAGLGSTGRRSRRRATQGRNLFRRTAATSATRATRGRRTSATRVYFLYPKISQPGDFFGSDQSPNLLGTERTGPDLSQEAGWHPDDWQRAHFYDPRFVDPLSLMPPMKSLFSGGQVEQLISFVRCAGKWACSGMRASCTRSTS